MIKDFDRRRELEEAFGFGYTQYKNLGRKEQYETNESLIDTFKAAVIGRLQEIDTIYAKEIRNVKRRTTLSGEEKEYVVGLFENRRSALSRDLINDFHRNAKTMKENIKIKEAHEKSQKRLNDIGLAVIDKIKL